MTRAADFSPKHFRWAVADGVGTITLDRPARKNPLTFDSYRELTDTFHALDGADDVRAVVLTGEGGNFCSGGDVNDIIGPLVEWKNAGRIDKLREFTHLTGNLVKAMRGCPQPIVAAVDGMCVGAGAILAMASDIRFGTPESRVGFLFVKVGLSGADMGACAILPRIIGQGRAAELLYTGRFLDGPEAERWGFYNALPERGVLLHHATDFARSLAAGPSFAHAMTKRCLHEEWGMGVNAAIEFEAEAQAICMKTGDFERAYRAFVEKKKPEFMGD